MTEPYPDTQEEPQMSESQPVPLRKVEADESDPLAVTAGEFFEVMRQQFPTESALVMERIRNLKLRKALAEARGEAIDGS